MNIQSLSVCVPAGCPNNCAYCVSKMNNQPDNTYENLAESALCTSPSLTAKQLEEYGLLRQQYADRIAFARDNGCNTMMITSNGEAMMNMGFIAALCRMNGGLQQPFRWVELQASGIALHDENLYLLKKYRISTISVSLADIFNDQTNAYINGIEPKFQFILEDLCRLIKRYGFNLRLSLNMSDVYNGVAPEQIFARAAELGANQVTFRKLYVSDIYQGTRQAKWIENHTYDGFEDIKGYIMKYGKELDPLPFGPIPYSVHGLSIVIDLNCMNKGIKKDGRIKYLILRPDCHLYTRWDDKGSLLF